MDNVEFLRRLSVIKRNAGRIYDEIEREFFDKASQEISYICDTAIARFYSWQPNKYSRVYDYYNVYNFRIQNHTLTLQLGGEFMQYRHRVSNEYLYKLFKQGYHGGADDDKNGTHPNVGIPYWKGPIDYHYWYKEAYRSYSPYEEIAQQFKEYARTRAPKLFSSIRKKVYGRYI